MATRQRGCAAKKASTCSRRSFLRNRTAPEALAACAWNTFLARSNPIVLTSVTDASLQVAVNTTTLARRCRRGASTPSLKRHSLTKGADRKGSHLPPRLGARRDRLTRVPRIGEASLQRSNEAEELIRALMDQAARRG